MTLSSAAPGAVYDPAQDVLQRRHGPVMQLWRGTGLVLWQNLQIEAKELAAVVPMGAVGFLVALIMSLIADVGIPASRPLAAGVLWGAMLLAGPIGLERQHSGPDFHAVMSCFLLAPLPRPAIYLGQWLFHCLLMLGTAGVALVAVAMFWDAPVGQVWILTSVLLGCMGFSAIGIVVSTLTATMPRSRGLLAVVSLPLMVPLFLIGTSICRTVWDGASWPSFQHGFYLLLLYNGLGLLGGLWISERIWQEWS